MKMINRKMLWRPAFLTVCVLLLLDAVVDPPLRGLWGDLRGMISTEIEEEEEQRGAIRAILRAYHDPGGWPATRQEYWRLLREHPEYVEANPTNQGAEILYAIFVVPVQPDDIDIDSDGRPEAHDVWGDPLIFLTNDRRSDVVMDSKGVRTEVATPPYYGQWAYINSLRFHAWLQSDAEALAETTQPSEKSSRP